MTGDSVVGTDRMVHQHGFVRVVDVMGDDSAVVQAARVSYGEGTKTPSSDRALIRYLMRHYHTTPFEMCEIKLHVRLPIFVARQWIRHRTASVNEHSGRYSLMNTGHYTPVEWRRQSESNRQGSEDEVVREPLYNRMHPHDCRTTTEAYESLWDSVGGLYQDMIDNDTSRELARLVLPVSDYTEWYWKIDLHNLLNFLKLRLDEHAQQEIRDYARVVADVVAEWVPATWEAFEDYRLHAVTLSRQELAAVRRMLQAGFGGEFSAEVVETGLAMREDEECRMSDREWSEFWPKVGVRS